MERCRRRPGPRAFGSTARAALAALLASVLLPAAAAAAVGPWRGIVEGPYGPPWDHAQRTRMLGWLGDHGLNAYVHAPKDDLYQRTLWREPYPAAEMAEFREEIALASRRGVAWIPNLSPALPLVPTPAVPSQPPSRPLCFSCADDLEAVLAKFEPFRQAGSRTFMVSFDDVIPTLSDPRDVAAYGSGEEAYGRANGDFLSRLHDALRRAVPGARLLTVGYDYSGGEDSAYLSGLRSTLAAGIDVMWTGTNVPAEDWPADAAHGYAERIGRRPVVWDNWTNNDTAGSPLPAGAARIFLGAYRRRADAAGAVRGFFFNPMNDADLNMLPLATAARWMRAPSEYRPRPAFLAAVDELADGERAADHLRAWAETSWQHKLDPQTAAPTFGHLRDAFVAAYGEGGDWLEPVAALRRELRLVERAGAALDGAVPRPFLQQARPWLDAGSVAAAGGRLATELLEAERPSLAADGRGGQIRGSAAPPDPAVAAAVRVRYREQALRFGSSYRLTYGWRGGVGFDIPPYAVSENAMDSFFAAVDRLDAAWQPRAAEAASRVSVTLDGEPVELDRAGHFTLPRSACGGRLVATDGAGGRTALRIVCAGAPRGEGDDARGPGGGDDRAQRPPARTPAATGRVRKGNGSLPFTGRSLILVLLAGAACAGCGVALRRAGRRSR